MTVFRGKVTQSNGFCCMKICLRFWPPGGTKSSVSRDLLKVFGFCKMFWIAKNICDTVSYNCFCNCRVAFTEVEKLWR